MALPVSRNGTASSWPRPSASTHYPDVLANRLSAAFAYASTTTTRVVQALARTGGRVGPADSFAQSMGLQNRHQLRRILAADGIPSVEDLARRIRILAWVVETETSCVALSRRALHAGDDPAPWYRLVKRLTGKTWREVLALGPEWVLAEVVLDGVKQNASCDEER